ncbi:hypothetical protein R9C00_20475 [Flammeovirgaceae bacterium SG7u.111]|nr:hypothetical protein [Flammeovirgaceae bacterium SG7u.132]WPO34078.1 hypothetical protein R9C00_20475 [Flammeovirgaceae bacterium SG7u.111]
MKKKDRTFKMYLEDLLLATERIAEYIEGYTYEQFERDHKTVDAVIRTLKL